MSYITCASIELHKHYGREIPTGCEEIVNSKKATSIDGMNFCPTCKIPYLVERRKEESNLVRELQQFVARFEGNMALASVVARKRQQLEEVLAKRENRKRRSNQRRVNRRKEARAKAKQLPLLLG